MHRTARRILLIATAFALFVVPAAAIPAAGFADVADDSASDADSLDSTTMISTAASAARSRSLVIPHFAPIVSFDAFEVPANGGAILIDASVIASGETATSSEVLAELAEQARL